MTGRAGEWRFLRKWFTTLESVNVRCKTRDAEDEVRVGSDPWLELSFTRRAVDPRSLWDSDSDSDSSDDDDYALYDSEQPSASTRRVRFVLPDVDRAWTQKPAVRERLRRAREAIALTSVVARVDFAAWRVMAAEYAGLTLPPQWLMPGATAVLPCSPLRMKLVFETESNQDWGATLTQLLGTREYSAEYEEDMKQVQDILARRGIAWESMEPALVVIQLKLNGKSYLASGDSARLVRLAETVQHTQRVAEGSTGSTIWCGSLLSMEALEIDVGRARLHDQILEALGIILQAGVPVHYLRLPQLQRNPSFATWATFVRLALGVDKDDHGRLASVRHLVMPATYAETCYFEPFCSALAMARGINVLEFEGSTHPDRTNAFGADDTVDRDNVWRWLSFALLSHSSQSSVKRLVLKGERPLLRDSETMEAMMNSVSPLSDLYKAFYGTTTHEPPVPISQVMASTSHTMTIPMWTSFRLCDATWGSNECRATHSLTGQWLGTHATSGESLVLVPGFGFCVLDEPEPAPPAKRAKVSLPVSSPFHAGSSFQSIVLRSNRTHSVYMDAAALGKFLSVLGSRLRSFGLEDVRCRDATLRAVLTSCPNLESLAIKNAMLVSMAAITDAYACGATHLTSLSLPYCVMPEDSARAFVVLLADPHHPMAQTLERLRWTVMAIPEEVRGTDYFGMIHSVTSDLEKVLVTNTALTHVDVVNDVRSFHGQRIPGRSRLQKQQLVAFLGAMLTAVPSMDGPVRRQIWAFAEAERFRCVVSLGFGRSVLSRE